MSSKRHVVVIGAGVTGLTSSIFLAESGYQVTIIATHIPGDESIEYTSPWAGAHWGPTGTSDPRIQDWDVQTYEYWNEVLERERNDPLFPKSGLKMQDSYDFWDTRPNQDLWWAPYAEQFCQVSTVLDPVGAINEKSEVAGLPGIKWAGRCRAASVNVPHYLKYLQAKAEAQGVKVIKTRLPTGSGFGKALTVAEGTVQANERPAIDCFLNCSGLGALKLCDDQAMFPIRGQTVLVKGEALATRTRIAEDFVAYCIPRPGAGNTILGGVKEEGRWNAEPDSATTEMILERNAHMVPELLTGADGGFEVISVQVGLRPGRHGGPRMEKETVGGKKVVHAYGHGSAGYQNSIGSARLAVKLVTESTGGSNVIAKL